MAFPTPTRTILAPEYRCGLKPLVYAWKRGNQFLYVGRSILGLARIYSHNRINKVEKVLDGDEILVWVFDTPREANDHEICLIQEAKPKYNVAYIKSTAENVLIPCLMCKKPFRQVRYWQKFCSLACSRG